MELEWVKADTGVSWIAFSNLLNINIFCSKTIIMISIYGDFRKVKEDTYKAFRRVRSAESVRAWQEPLRR